MSDKFISLKCPSCGGKLDVYEDMNNFACGYCGTEITTKRRGGTVMLEALTHAIGKVQAGTDKTAAELAIVRLQKELVALEAQLKGQTGTGSGGILILFGMIFAVSSLTNMADKAKTTEDVFLCIALAIGFCWGGWSMMGSRSKKVRELTAARDSVKVQLEKNIEVANK